MTVTDYTVDLRRLEDFPAGELYALLKLRVDIFVVEQKCPYPELDGKDPEALHLRLMADEELLAAARIFPPSSDGAARIGRVAVSPQHRGKRLGEAVMREAITACGQHFPGKPIALSAQSHLLRFYQALGFVAVSDEYLEDGIPHIDMKRDHSQK